MKPRYARGHTPPKLLDRNKQIWCDLLDLCDHIFHAHDNCRPTTSYAVISTVAAGLAAYSSAKSDHIIQSRGVSSRKGVRRRRVPSWVKPSLRGTAALRTLLGSQCISTRCIRSISKATFVSAALASVARP